MDKQTELTKIRKKIDHTDSEIISLLGRRMEYALQTRRLKINDVNSGTVNEIIDLKREAEVLANCRKLSGELTSAIFLDKLFREIITESKRLQEKELKLAGFQGEHGAYSEMALLHGNSVVPMPCVDFSDVFAGVTNGTLDFGIIPVENSIAGNVNIALDLLMDMDTELSVIEEIVLPVHHCLLALPETDYREIRVVYSHPMALLQCNGFISRNGLEARPFYDTAGAAKMIAKERPVGGAAIASRLCAEKYGLEVLKENIEDDENNTTRFLLIAKTKSNENITGNKCSMILSTAHKPGALSSVLKIFSEHNVNLTRIESRPMKHETRKVAFLIDFQGSILDKNIADMLDRIKKDVVYFRLLGCYPEIT